MPIKHTIFRRWVRSSKEVANAQDQQPYIPDYAARLNEKSMQSQRHPATHAILKTHVWYVTRLKLSMVCFPFVHNSFFFYTLNYTFHYYTPYILCLYSTFYLCMFFYITC